jgi:hypothetical protein
MEIRHTADNRVHNSASPVNVQTESNTKDHQELAISWMLCEARQNVKQIPEYRSAGAPRPEGAIFKFRYKYRYNYDYLNGDEQAAILGSHEACHTLHRDYVRLAGCSHTPA